MTEVETIEKYAKQCMNCSGITLLPYQYQYSCIAFGYNVFKQTQ